MPDTPSAEPAYPLLLVALEDTAWRVRILDALPNHGWRVMTAGSEGEILSLVPQHQCDALLVEPASIRPDSVFLPLALPTLALIPSRTADEVPVATALLRDCGVSACLDRPLDIDLLAASLAAILRLSRDPQGTPRLRPRAGEQGQDWQFQTTHWQLTTPEGQRIQLNQQESAFIEVLAAHPGQPVTRRDVVQFLGHDIDYYDPRRLDTLLSRLRTRIGRDGSRTLPVRCIHGVGFAFVAPIRIES